MRILCLIPGREGSKGLINKNILPILGKPLIGYTIDAARKIFNDSDICISTDSEKIIEYAESIGLSIPFKRPENLSGDFSTTEDVILHAIKFYETKNQFYDYLILLQPTSPLRSSENIKEAISLIKPNIEMIASVKETNANPYYVLFEESKNGSLVPIIKTNFSRRQDCPTVYELNGAIYIYDVLKLKSKGIVNLEKTKYLMTKSTSVDIDDEFDFKFASYLIEKLNSNEEN